MEARGEDGGAALALLAHPATPCDAVRRLGVRVRRTEEGVLALRFVLEADLARLAVPPPAAPRMAHDLWRHTCFEAFVALEEGPAYHELNFSPSGAWGAFAFRAPRDGGPSADAALAPDIRVRTGRRRLVLDARVRLGLLSAGHARLPLRLGLAAVVEEAGGARSYWALRHGPGDPDFHRPESLALRLAAPPGAC